jgi:hypothetical protein
LRSLGKQPYRDMILSPDELSETRLKYPREVRRQMEGRWGFTELVTAISKLAERSGQWADHPFTVIWCRAI